MPSKNSVKVYLKGGIYHVYNRGVNRENIYRDEDDYSYFVYLLDRYLSRPPRYNVTTKNYCNDVELLVFCLMPTHFHFVIYQKDIKIISEFMQSLLVSYARRFNEKHRRIGHLFQDRYKARIIESDYDLINTSKYIHTNPKKDVNKLENYPFSSLQNYTSPYNVGYSFLSTGLLLEYFNNSKSKYKDYVYSRDQTPDSSELRINAMIG